MLVNGEQSQLAFDFVAGHSKGQEQLFRGQTLADVHKLHAIECLQALGPFRPERNRSAVGTVTRVNATHARYNCAYPDGSEKVLTVVPPWHVHANCMPPFGACMARTYELCCRSSATPYVFCHAMLNQGSVKPWSP